MPDPAFHFEHPADHTRMMSQWWRGTRTRLAHWQAFYTSAEVSAGAGPAESLRRLGGEPDRAGQPRRRARVGHRSRCVLAGGPGVRSHRFRLLRRRAQRGPGDDRAPQENGKKPVRFKGYNLESPYNLLTSGARLAHEPGPKHVYARLLVDALAAPARSGLWRFCSMVGRSGGHTFLEFRTDANRGHATYFGPHAAHLRRPRRGRRRDHRVGGHVVDRVEGTRPRAAGQGEPRDLPAGSELDPMKPLKETARQVLDRSAGPRIGRARAPGRRAPGRPRGEPPAQRAPLRRARRRRRAAGSRRRPGRRAAQGRPGATREDRLTVGRIPKVSAFSGAARGVHDPGSARNHWELAGCRQKTCIPWEFDSTQPALTSSACSPSAGSGR